VPKLEKGPTVISVGLALPRPVSLSSADRRTITPALYDELLPQVMAKIEEEVGTERFKSGHYKEAADLFTKMSKSEEFEEFLTLPAYELID
jgi:malate synthase